MNIKLLSTFFLGLIFAAISTLLFFCISFLLEIESIKLHNLLEEKVEGYTSKISEQVDEASISLGKFEDCLKRLAVSKEPKIIQKKIEEKFFETISKQTEQFNSFFALTEEFSQKLFKTSGHVLTVTRLNKKNKYRSKIYKDPSYLKGGEVWWNKALGQKEAQVTPLYFDKSYMNVWMYSVVKEVRLQEKLIGVVGVDILAEDFLKSVEMHENEKYLDYFLVNSQGHILSNSESIKANFEFDENPFNLDHKGWQDVKSATNLFYRSFKGKDGVKYGFLTKQLEHFPISLVAYYPKDLLFESAIKKEAKRVIGGIILCILICIAAFYLFRKINSLHQRLSDQSKFAMIGHMAAGIGHEINNPLSIILGRLSMMERKIYKDLPEKKLEYEKQFQKAFIAIERIEKIINGIRNVSRNKSPKHTYFDPMGAIRESVDMVSPFYETDGIELLLSNSVSNSLQLYGDRVNFEQILMNLLSNSKDAVKNSSVKRIKIETALVEKNLIVLLTDTGCGIAKKDLDKIFQPFFTTKAVHEGTGIGMSLVKRYIEDMKGQIEVSSVVNEGTQVKLTLPVKIS